MSPAPVYSPVRWSPRTPPDNDFKNVKPSLVSSAAGELGSAPGDILIIGEGNAQKRKVSEAWNRKSGSRYTVKYEHAATVIESMKEEVKTWAESYGITYKDGKAELMAVLPINEADIVMWTSSSTREETDLKLHPYFDGVDLSKVEADFLKNRCRAFDGELIGYGDAKKNKFRDYLLAGVKTYTTFRQVIKRTTTTRNGSDLTDELSKTGKIDDPPLPAGTPITKSGTYLKMAPQVTANDGTYVVEEEWLQGDWDEVLYG